MRWLIGLLAVGLAVSGVVAADAAPRSFVRQCEKQGHKPGTAEFEKCIAKIKAKVERQRRESQNYSP